MKHLYYLFCTKLVIIVFFLSCEKNKEINYQDFSIEFSDGTKIIKDDVAFYDSSTCILFLKEKIPLKHAEGEFPDLIYNEFFVYIDNEKIYSGMVWPDDVAMASPESYYIGTYTYPDVYSSEIIRLNHFSFDTSLIDYRKDERIIKYFKDAGLLRNGISCIIDSVKLAYPDESSVAFTISVLNNDAGAYFIPDLNKMGEDQFNHYMGGLYLTNLDTTVYFHLNTSPSCDCRDSLRINDLSLIEGYQKVSFSLRSSYDEQVIPGTYRCRFRYGNLWRLYAFDLELIQDDGRIWVGESFPSMEGIIAE